MRKILKNGQGEFLVSIIKKDSTGVKVELKENAPFADKGQQTWVAPRFLKEFKPEST